MKGQERHSSFRSAVACALRPTPSLSFVLLLPMLFCAAGRLRADDVTRSVQEELRKRNLYFGDVDGSRTPQLAAALRRYQGRKGFSATGDADETTLRSLSLRAPEPLGFAPPAAAVSVTNPNFAAPNDVSPSAGNTPGTLEDGSVTRWPNTTVLRSDRGRANPPTSILFNALNNLSPGTADATSPPGRFTAIPSSSSLATQYPTSGDVRAFVLRYLRAGQANDPDAEMKFYGDQVKYFDSGTVDRSFIARDVRLYDNKWPQRSFSVVGPITVVADANDINHTLVRFRYRFTNRNRRLVVGGEVNTLYTLEGSGPDSLRIIALSEQDSPEKRSSLTLSHRR